MRDINLRYVEETYDEHGILSRFGVNCPTDFNFAYDVVDDIAAVEADRPAMVWCNPEGEEHTFNFGDMKRWSDKTANHLSSLGIGRGDMVMVILRRHYQFWFIALALQKIGAIMVPATFMLKEHDLTYRIQSAGVKALICTSAGEIAATADAVQAQCPTLETRIIVNGAGGGMLVGQETDADGNRIGAALSAPDGICAARCTREGWLDFNTGVREASEEWTRVPTRAADPFLLYFSSGTSGNPKMVLHSGSYPLGHIPTAKHWHNVVSDGGVHLTIADTGWAKSVWGKLYGQWLMEACVFTYDFDRFVPSEILGAIEKYRITTLCCPPTMYRLMMAEGLGGFDLSSLVYCTTAGEALNPDLFEGWKEHTGLPLVEGFGQTEMTCCILNTVGMECKPGSMGKPSPQYTIELQDGSGRPCPAGQTGEVVAKIDPAPVGLMMGYYLDPERTAEVMRDGWYHTGDLAWADEDGYYWFVGRNDDVIKSSGYRIGPFEVESVLLEHDAVREVAVTGVPDEVRGHAVKATIVLNGGYEGSEELVRELQTWVKKRTAPYKYPRIVDFVEVLPKTVNGKIRRAAIRDNDAGNREE
ncbi:MAG: AMP-binding protein [Coriobacteriia bacterium]|nr:AMP-binding protein [Coriobacteriia bacterium]MBN2847322.1 AMP-binding protein [Coriobacteriia bacterium]